jgi:hypothetical protein
VGRTCLNEPLAKPKGAPLRERLGGLAARRLWPGENQEAFKRKREADLAARAWGQVVQRLVLCLTLLVAIPAATSPQRAEPNHRLRIFSFDRPGNPMLLSQLFPASLAAWFAV